MASWPWWRHLQTHQNKSGSGAHSTVSAAINWRGLSVTSLETHRTLMTSLSPTQLETQETPPNAIWLLFSLQSELTTDPFPIWNIKRAASFFRGRRLQVVYHGCQTHKKERKKEHVCLGQWGRNAAKGSSQASKLRTITFQRNSKHFSY